MKSNRKPTFSRLGIIVLGCMLCFASLSCASFGNTFPGSEAYGELEVSGLGMVCIDDIIVQRNLEADTVRLQFLKVVPFLLEERGWKVVSPATEGCYNITFLLQEFESFKNFTATKVVQAEMAVYKNSGETPVFLARVWTDGQSTLLDEPLLRRLARILIKQIPKVKMSKE